MEQKQIVKAPMSERVTEKVIPLTKWFAEQYYHSGADELIYQDAVASLYRRNSLTEIIKSTAKRIFIPLTV